MRKELDTLKQKINQVMEVLPQADAGWNNFLQTAKAVQELHRYLDQDMQFGKLLEKTGQVAAEEPAVGIWNTLEAVSSSAIDSFNYRFHAGRERIDLIVNFKNGHVFQYNDLPAYVVGDLEETSSTGRYYNLNIKGCYKSEKIS